MNHPFLDDSFHIKWSLLTPEHVESSITLALEEAQKNIDAVANNALESLTFENTLLALEAATEGLSHAWGCVTHLDSVNNSKALRDAHNAMLPSVTEFYTRIPLNEQLWKVIKAYSKTDEAQNLTGAPKRFLEETLADFEESGADLPPEQKKKLEAVNAELSQLTQKYSENLLDSTNAWEKIVEDAEMLKGLPQSAIDAALDSAKQKGLATDESPKWRFTLQIPSLLPVLKFADSDAFRKEIWEASSQIGYTAPHDNTDIIWGILKVRNEKAKILGKDNFANFVLKRRMAKNGETALHFVEDMHDRVKTAFEQEISDLQAYKAEKSNQPNELLEPWETTYWAEKRRLELFDFDEEKLRPYFAIGPVIEGMFKIVEAIYGINIQQRSTIYTDPETKESQRHTIGNDQESVEVWHPEVQFYEIFEKDGHHIGSFYADWHPRETKRSGAWMNYFKTGSLQEDGSLSPHLGLVCGNLSPSVNNKPALMTHDEVGTIFHEFGHLLHHLLGKVEVKSLNGVNVAWDFVELPSQFMENWCWEKAGLDLFAKHYETQEALPNELFEKMIAARTYLEASTTMRQLSFGKMDLELHINYEQYAGQELEALIRKLLEGYTAQLKTTPPSIARRFGHLFSESTGYAAGYYSYKWAEVLDADAFTRFKEEGILNEQTGREFREKILSKGNSEAPEKLYRDFMGRDPDLDALLVRAGLKAANS